MQLIASAQTGKPFSTLIDGGFSLNGDLDPAGPAQAGISTHCRRSWQLGAAFSLL